MIVRSAVPTRDIGFLKGDEKQKVAIYEEPYREIVADLFGRSDAYSILKNKKKIEFITTSYIRGKTFDDTILLIDECQNMTDIELHSIITRLGENSKLILCGDFRQDDLTSKRYNTESGLIKILNILKEVSDVEMVEFGVNDILRSKFVKDYIIAREKHEKDSLH